MTGVRSALVVCCPGPSSCVVAVCDTVFAAGAGVFASARMSVAADAGTVGADVAPGGTSTVAAVAECVEPALAAWVSAGRIRQRSGYGPPDLSRGT
jgi:hypothetical protein